MADRQTALRPVEPVREPEILPAPALRLPLLRPVPAALSTVSCLGFSSTVASWRRPRTPTIRCSSGSASCRFPPITWTSSSWSGSPASRPRSRPGSPPRARTGTPSEQLVRINEAVKSLGHDQQARWRELRQDLAAEKIIFVDPETLKKAERTWLEDYFLHYIFPVLTPLAIDPAHPFPFIPNFGFTLAPAQPRRQGDERADPHAEEDRALHSPAGDRGGLCPPDHAGAGDPVVHAAAVPGLRGEGQGGFRVLRDLEVEIEEEAEDLVRLFETVLKAAPARIGDPAGADASDAGGAAAFRRAGAAVADDEIFVVEGVFALGDLSQLTSLDRPSSSSPTIRRFPERIRDRCGDCFAAIRQKDLIVDSPVRIASTPSSSSCIRRRATPTWSPSSRPCIAPPSTARSCRCSPRPPRPAR